MHHVRIIRGGLLAAALLALFSSTISIARAEPTAHGKKPRPTGKIVSAEQAQAQFRLPPGLKVELVAADDLLANPVAFCFDRRGRIYLAETFRKSVGIEDNRKHMSWLNDDLAAQSIEDRRRMFAKHLGKDVEKYGQTAERIRLLEDRDGDGKYDHSAIFADDFHDVLDGTGAGVLERDGQVYFACIPNLWRLADKDGDGRADERTALHSGYGVRVAFHGHDLHGLCWGPDGRLYYSIGDRGFHIETEGHVLAFPDRGAVFRCEPDGSKLEVFALGLRNPQELAFDDYGDLFTGDNNSDSGDKARFVHVVEGGDSGWRMNYQYLPDRGPWNREKLWHLAHAEQPAYIVPPMAHLADGPSGLAYDPGVGLPAKYRQHFFLCDFRGGSVNSGVRSFAVRPKGASFELTDAEQFVWSLLATDCEFAADGSLYVSDWLEGWENTGRGRIWRIFDPAAASDPSVVDSKKLLAEDFRGVDPNVLAGRLTHRDRRVRLEAQFALAVDEPARLALLARIAQSGLPATSDNLPRLHAIWGLGQVARQRPAALDPVVPLLADPDVEIRAQLAKVIGDAGLVSARPQLESLLADGSPRVRMMAALALAKVGDRSSIAPLVKLVRDNADRDPVLRHAGVMGLAGCGDTATLLAHAADTDPAVRLAVLLALRRQASPELSRFLDDADPRLVDEAARAIHDVPIPAATPRLAALAERANLSESTWRRVLAANFALGGAANALAVARIGTRHALPDVVQIEALDMLAHWSHPGPRDRVLGSWHPLPARDDRIAVDALRPVLAQLLRASDTIRPLGIQLAAKLGFRELGPVLFDLSVDHDRPAGVRVEALAALEALNDSRRGEAVDRALADREPALRAAAGEILAQRNPDRALAYLQHVLVQGNDRSAASQVEQQAALATLATLRKPEADAILSDWMKRLAAGKVAPELQLDLLNAVRERTDFRLKRRLAEYEAARKPDDPLAGYRETLAGGDAERGRKIFQERAEVSCIRCHRVRGVGGEVGPDLSKIGGEKPREYLLTAIVEPNQSIAKGFESVSLVLDDGRTISGVLKSETADELRVITPEGKLLTIPAAQIEERATGKSSMPEDLVRKLETTELRDLVEFLASLRGAE